MAKDKALLFDLSSSISYGRLSLKGKVLWPMLLIKSDDQGRGQAEPDWIKWRVCPNVEEITITDIADILAEMASDRIGLLHLYQDGRHRKLYQIIRWWESDLGSGSSLQWARPSEYQAPAGWMDRIRIQHGPGEHELVNWDQPGGFNATEPVEDQPGPTPEPPGEPASQPPGKPPTGITKLNLTKPNGTKEGADAPPPEPPATRRKAKKDEPPAVAKYREATNLNPVKTLYEDLDELIGRDPDDLDRWYRTCKAWVAMGWNRMNVKGMAQHYVEGRIPGDDQRARASPGESKSAAIVRQWAEEKGVTWQATEP